MGGSSIGNTTDLMSCGWWWRMNRIEGTERGSTATELLVNAMLRLVVELGVAAAVAVLEQDGD
jgi:hypothetical protein